MMNEKGRICSYWNLPRPGNLWPSGRSGRRQCQKVHVIPNFFVHRSNFVKVEFRNLFLFEMLKPVQHDVPFFSVCFFSNKVKSRSCLKDQNPLKTLLGFLKIPEVFLSLL